MDAAGGGDGSQPTLHTARLTLRPFEQADAPAVQKLAGAWEVADTTLHIPHPYPDGGAEAWIATHAETWTNGSGLTYAITDRSDGTVIGAIGLTIAPQHARAELGYWMGVPYWNRGFCTEAGMAVVELAFVRLGLHRVQSRHLTRNPASGRVMQKLGMQLEGIHRETVRKSGRFEDLALYAILESEWRRAGDGSRTP
jgi:RimJ/RimL family protein N-acetyltransferase